MATNEIRGIQSQKNISLKMALHKIQPFQSVSHQILPQIDFYSSVSSKRTLAMNGKRVGPEKKKLSNMLFNRNYFI